MNTPKSAILRWSTLIVVLLNIAFNYFYISISGHPSMGSVSARYPSLFTPPAFAFSIWGLIYFSFCVYCFIQLQPWRKNKKVYNQLSLPLLVANILAAAWIWVYTSGFILASVIILGVMLILSIDMFVTAGKASLSPKHSWWIQVPFSLFCGWLSVAFLANLSVLIAAQQGKPNSNLTLVLLAVACLAVVIVSLRSRNALYPAVIAWACVALWSIRKYDYPQIAFTALAISIVSIIMIIAAAYRWSDYKKKID